MDQAAVAVVPASALLRFARRLQSELDAQQVLLFGSRARGQQRGDSDYDLIVVSPRFEGVEAPLRGIGLRELWYRSGGQGALDLICLTPTEFHDAQRRISLIAEVLPEAVDLLSDRVAE